MKKEDLKNGNVVELRDGGRYIKTCIGGFEFIRIDYTSATETAFFLLNDFEDGLKGSMRTFDIMKVYEDYTLKKVLWERKEKPKLTEDEKAILRNIDKKYKYIARDDSDNLFIHNTKPKKDGWEWSSDNGVYRSLVMFNHLFQFIKWEDEEPYLISDLLEED